MPDQKKLPTALLIILSLLSCEKDEPQLTELEKLPPATQSGKYTFGCLVNGKAWVTRTTIDSGCAYEGCYLQIFAEVDDKQRDESMAFFLEQCDLEIKTYQLKDYDPWGARFASRPCYYDYQNLLSGTLTITKLDRTKLIISGNFEFTTVTTDCDTIRITDGRFDLRYTR